MKLLHIYFFVIFLLSFHIISCKNNTPTGNDENVINYYDLLSGNWTLINYAGSLTNIATYINPGYFITNITIGSWYEGTFSINTTVVPVHIDLFITNASSSSLTNKTSLGIIEASSYTQFKVCFNQPDNPTRPTEFTTNGDLVLYTGTKQ